MVGRFERIVSFLKLHYCLTKRDEPYWRDNADPATWPEALRDLLAQWKHRPVSRFDFLVDLETFLPSSYQYILYGMNAATDFAPVEGRYDEGAVARPELRQGGRGGAGSAEAPAAASAVGRGVLRAGLAQSLPCGEAAEGRWGSIRIEGRRSGRHPITPLRRLRRHLPHRGRD